MASWNHRSERGEYGTGHPSSVRKVAQATEQARLSDAVAPAYAEYVAAGGTLSAERWHKRYAPLHTACNLCHD